MCGLWCGDSNAPIVLVIHYEIFLDKYGSSTTTTDLQQVKMHDQCMHIHTQYIVCMVYRFGFGVRPASLHALMHVWDMLVDSIASMKPICSLKYNTYKPIYLSMLIGYKSQCQPNDYQQQQCSRATHLQQQCVISCWVKEFDRACRQTASVDIKVGSNHIAAPSEPFHAYVWHLGMTVKAYVKSY